MTAFAETVLPLETGQLRLTLRSVNHKALDLSLRIHPALFPLEAAIRCRVREAAQRGKLDLTVEVQDEPALEPQINRPLLRAMAKSWQPGAWVASSSDLAERLEGTVLAGLDGLLETWNAARTREARRLEPFFQEGLARLRGLWATLRDEAELQARELPEQYRQRLEQVLKDAQLAGQLPAERVVAEAGALAERQDVREELVRLAAHLDDLAERLKQGRLGGKALDIWSQELLRELNTCGSKCKRLAMTRAVMEAKGALDQIREQGANLE
jgi:uncharacterized protein YicC (UPF0701 family)